MESDRDGAVMHIPEAGVYFGEGGNHRTALAIVPIGDDLIEKIGRLLVKGQITQLVTDQ